MKDCRQFATAGKSGAADARFRVASRWPAA